MKDPIAVVIEQFAMENANLRIAVARLQHALDLATSAKAPSSDQEEVANGDH